MTHLLTHLTLSVMILVLHSNMKNNKTNKVKKLHNSIKIINESSKSIPLNLEKIILKLLKVVPDEHLIGLESISLVDEFPEKKYKNALGTYSQKYGLDKARIEISVEYLSSYKPYVLRLIPFLGKYYLARVLFHEIGHHYRHLRHGISKKENENFADQYEREMLGKVYSYLRFFKRPYKFLKHWLGREKPLKN